MAQCSKINKPVIMSITYAMMCTKSLREGLYEYVRCY